MTNAFKYLYIFFYLLLMIHNSGCSEKTNGNLALSDTGAAVFAIVWPDEDPNIIVGGPTRSLGDSTIDCVQKGISTIKVDVYDGSPENHLTGDSFACLQGKGRIDHIPVGYNRLFVVTGNDSSGQAVYKGQTEAVAIIDREYPTDVGHVEMWRLNNTQPTVTIDNPKEGNTVFSEGEKITFSGTGYDAEDGALAAESLVWTSDVIGQIGIGTTFTIDNLPPGTHQITLTAIDFDNAAHTESLTIRVEVAIQLKIFELTLGAQNNPNGFAASLTNGIVYFYDNGEVKQHSSDIDIFYNSRPEYDEALYSPHSTTVHDDETGIYYVRDAEWEFYRETRIDYTSLPSSIFNEINYAHQLPDMPSSNSDYADKLRENDVLAFQTETGHRGIILVNDLDRGIEGYIELVVKVEP